MKKLNLILKRLSGFYGTEKTLVAGFTNSNKSERLSFSPILTHKACPEQNAKPLENILENLFARTAGLRIRGERV
jgi:hypothetical protein